MVSPLAFFVCLTKKAFRDVSAMTRFEKQKSKMTKYFMKITP